MRSVMIIALLVLIISCKDKPLTRQYTNRLFGISVPNGWVLREKEAEFVPISVYANDKSPKIVPNYNVTLINPAKKSLIEVAMQNSKNNCLKGTCITSTFKRNTRNGLFGYETFQDILINNNSVIIRQYYFEKNSTVYLLSFFSLKEDYKKVESVFNEIFNSFILKDQNNI